MNGVNNNNTEPLCKKIQNYIFKFTDLLGQGNFSKVYKAHNQLTNQIVAVKIIQLNSLKSQKLEELLFSEIDVLKKLNHPNILRCYEVFTSNRNCYIIAEICNGGDLQTKLRRQHHFSEQSAQPIIKDIFSGLLYLAQKNVIHRDLKVANVFLHNGKAKIADFGFAKFTKQNFKDINIGSPIYMAPEGLINNIYGPKTDVWAFGILLFELLHGETPFAHCRSQSELKYAVSQPLNSSRFRPQLSPQIKQVMLLCLQTDQSKRITAFQLEKHPYFRNLMQKSPLRRMDSPILQKKYSTASQKYVGGSNKDNSSLSQQVINKYNFLASRDQSNNSSLKPYSFQQNSNYKKSLSPLNPPNKNTSAYSSQKIPSLNSHQAINRNYSPLKNGENGKILTTKMKFKEIVNLLHYCRLIYKFVIALRQSPYHDENGAKYFSSWVLGIMDQIKAKINDNDVDYGQNEWVKQKKLREVTNQYMKKYKHQLFFEGPLINTSVSSTLKFALQFYQRVDTEISRTNDPIWIILGHYIVMIASMTDIVQKCCRNREFKEITKSKELQDFLSKNKDQMRSQSYKLLRQKVNYIH